MKFVLSLQEWVLNEKSRNRRDVLNIIENMRYTLNEHLFKYYLMPYSIDRNHWFDEIKSAFLGKIARYKWHNKLFIAENYYEILFIEYFKSETNYENKFEEILTDYNSEYIISYNIEDFKKRCDLFYRKVCSDLANGQYNKDIDISEIIKVFDI